MVRSRETRGHVGSVLLSRLDVEGADDPQPTYRQLEFYPRPAPKGRRSHAGVAVRSRSAAPVPLGRPPVTAFQRERLLRFWREALPRAGETVKDRIDLYRPEAISADLWIEIEPMAKEWVTVAAASDLTTAPRMLTVLCKHLAWCHGIGLELRADVVLHVDTIEQFAAEGLPGKSPGSASTYRSLLRAVGETVLGPGSFPTRQRLMSGSDPEAPYTDNEVSDLLGAARGLTTPHRRDNALVVMSCGLGAGLANSDLAGLVGSDVDDSGPVVAINITFGPRPRRVVVLADWEDEMVRRAHEVGERPMFHPARTKINAKDIPNFLDRLAFPYLPRLALQRLRVTWIVRQLTNGVPVHVVAAAAGVGPAQIARYFQFLPEVAPHDADRLLRGGPDR